MESIPLTLKIMLAQLWPLVDDKSLRVIPIAGDASERRFWRLQHGALSVVGLYGLDEAENIAYFMIGRHLLKSGLPLPKMLIANPEAGGFIMEDLGPENLQALAPTPQGPSCTWKQPGFWPAFMNWGGGALMLNGAVKPLTMTATWC